MNAVGAALALNFLNDDGNNGRRINIQENAFGLSDSRFMNIFRVNKRSARKFISIVEPYMKAPVHLCDMNIDTKVLCALRFFASGSYQMDIGANRFLAISQPSVSRSLNEVINAANNINVINQWVRFPKSYEELLHLRDRFEEKYHIPAIGCIDCTHVAVVPPKSDDEVNPGHVYMNRKGFYSINVQLICDYNLRIINVNAKYPGSVHDSFIWNMSSVNESMKNIYGIWPDKHFHLFGI